MAHKILVQFITERFYKKYFIIIALSISSFINSSWTYANNGSALKSGFIYVDQVSPSIKVDIRYASSNNFLGRSLVGMNNNRAALSIDVALALEKVQDELELRGYSLVIYNAYIPYKAARQMEELQSNMISKDLQKLYYPNLSSEQLVLQGYIREKTDNIRGSTVDVSIIPANGQLKSNFVPRKRAYSNNRNMQFMDDGTIDMGTSYDTFDSLSAHQCEDITLEAKNNRNLLKEVMESHGFRASNLVWWKYTYIREPFSDSSFDFDI